MPFFPDLTISLQSVSGPIFALLCLVAVLCKNTSIIDRRKANPGRLPLPPGPKGIPIIGNLRDIPSGQAWITYTEWKEQYGDIVYASVFGQQFVVVNSLKVVNDLFDKRSQIYSDRPTIPMRDILGWDFVIGLMYYSDTWRKHRRCFHQKFKRDVSLAYRPAQMRKVHQLLQNLLSSPQDFVAHYTNMAAGIITSTMYGYEIASANDPFVERADRAITLMTNSMLPGVVTVNALPFLRYLPSFVPGAGFQRKAEECRVLTTEMLDLPFDLVKENMKQGIAAPSVTAELLEMNSSRDGSKEEEDVIKRIGATAYSAGADTVACAVGTFFHVAAVNPKARRRAQEEIDNVVGIGRLPNFEDRPSLPYVEAFYREVMRWRPAMPLGVAHATTEHDIYDGYFIPKGVSIMSNIWAMTRDETKYPNPELFQPERFFTADGQLNDDDTILTFGFGRRVCPGRHSAEASVWATIVSVLSTFDFAKAKDSSGKEIEIEGRYTDALISHVLPFRCSITPRSEAARRLIQETRTMMN